MDGLFWRLPGPSLFIERIGQSLRAGRNVIVALPEHGPARLRYAVAEAVAGAELHTWCPIELSNGKEFETSVAQLVANRCTPSPRPSTTKELAEHDHFRNLVVWVDGISPATWDSWRAFLEEYSHHCRARPEHERAVFCVPVAGRLVEALPREDVACAVQAWRGIVRRIDMLLLFSQLLAARRLSLLCSEVWIAVGAELSGTDPALAARFAAVDLETTLEPEALLREVARERGWSRRPDSERPAWALGHEDLLDGRSAVHSAWAVLDPVGKEEIDRRIWRAQVGVLFPHLEEARTEMLARLRRVLVVPHQTPFGTITDVRDFELGHLLHHARKYRVDPSVRARLERLTDVRHRLAHLEPVPFSLLVELDAGMQGS
jgi:hypothetical protein